MADHDDDSIEDEGIDEEMLELGFDQRTQLFLEMRQQNLKLLEIATQIAGFTKEHPPMRPDDVRKGLKTIWDVYSEIYTWVDPEESEDDEEDEDEE